MNILAQRRFLKMNGLGNEIVIVDLRGAKGRVSPEEACAVAGDPRSRFDQLMAIHDPRTPGTDAFLRIHNTDGSESGACGNGTRCVAWAMMSDREMGRAAGPDLLLETRAGLLPVARVGDTTFTVDMGRPRFRWDEIPLRDPFQDTRYIELQIGPIDAPILHSPSAVGMGNPHAIFWVDDVDAYDLSKIGPLLENHPIFPERANISLARIDSRDHIVLRVWERGAGLTRACGSAACAALVAAVRKKFTDRRATVTLPGGDLTIEWRERDDHVLMTGPVELEYDGVFAPELFAGGGVMAVEVVTFGCRLNAYESEAMQRQAEAAGHRDMIVVNTCAVTAEATRQARQAIRKLAREKPDARIVVTGCAAQVDPKTFAAMPEVALVLGNDAKTKPETWAGLDGFGIGSGEKILVNDIMAVQETAPHLIEGMRGRTRAFVQVQNGCDHRCTFCIIPYGRGNSRSVAMGAVVDQVRTLVEHGAREVVLTGVDITSYGADLPGAPKLGSLVKNILRHVPELERLRISSIDSVEADHDLLDAFGSEARLMPHLHLSLQAGDDLVLKRMKRRHLRDDAIRFCDTVRGLRPDVVFGADLIAGFPTETEEMFARSLDIVDACGLTHLHVFPFSARPGTPAARMPQVAREIVKDRARRLRQKGEAALAMHLAAEVGGRRQVLTETEALGRTEGFTLVRFARRVRPGDILAVTIAGHDGRELLAA